MFDAVMEHGPEWLATALAAAFLLVVISFGLIMLFSPSTVQGVEIHQLPNGVTCYTFNTSIDCLQSSVDQGE